MKTAYCVKQLRQDQRNPPIIALTGMRSNSLLKGGEPHDNLSHRLGGWM